MDIMNYNFGEGNDKNWIVEESRFDSRYLGKCESIFAQGNGYLGVRNALEERYIGETRNTFVTGIFNKASEQEVTELPNVPDVIETDIIINGYRFNLDTGKCLFYSRTLNLKTGETIRKIVWEAPDHTKVKATFRRFVSLSDEHVIAQRITIETDRDAEVVIDTGIHGEVTNSGAQHFKNIKCRVYDGVYMQYITETTQSGVVVALHSACSTDADVKKRIPIMKRRTLTNEYTIALKKDTEVYFDKISVIHTSRDLAYDKNEISDIVDTLSKDGLEDICIKLKAGYDQLFLESKEEWLKYWEKSDITIKGNDFDQMGIRFALYHLRSMVKVDDNRVGIAAKALTGEGYKGHSFWDTEMFILPYFTFTMPQVARTLLEYRYKNLYGAHKKAKEAGYEGAMYPWESAWIDDGEVTPRYIGADVVTGKILEVLTGKIEHHVTADIAYAVWQYYLVTGDQEFMDLYGYEIILDTALFWASRLEYNKLLNRYEINDVIGPDEYKDHVNNNAYTNYMAAFNMRLALSVLDDLYAEHPEVLNRLKKKLDLQHIREIIMGKIDKLYLPTPNENGIIPQSDQYLKLKPLDLKRYKNTSEVLTIYKDYNVEQLNQYMISKQADTVMLLFLLDDLFDMETKKKNFLFYEEHTLHDSSLSKCIHAILANDYGLDEMAYKLYEGANQIDLGPFMKSSDAGIHSASMGGVWESTVMGYGGVRMTNEGLRINPSLPAAWEELSYPLVYKGCRLVVSVTTKYATIRNCSDRAVNLILGNEEIEIEANTEVIKEIE